MEYQAEIWKMKNGVETSDDPFLTEEFNNMKKAIAWLNDSSNHPAYVDCDSALAVIYDRHTDKEIYNKTFK
jgi:hypothetical protein